MELRDDRVTIRPPTEADIPAVLDAVQSSQPELFPWLPWATPEYRADDARAWVTNGRDATAMPFSVLTPAGRLIGAVGLNHVSEFNRSANLGYWIRTDAAGNGYASAATKLLAAHILATTNLNRMEIVMSVENQASRRVAERTGAHYEGVMIKALFLHGRPHNGHLYSITRP